MLKKTITFNDLDGNEVTEDFYFNLNKAELAELEMAYEGGLSEQIQRLTQPPIDGALILSTFKDIITRAVGRRSEDGRRFIKNQQITDEFMQSDAYSEMFMELVTDGDKGAEFIAAIMPADLVAQAQSGQKIVDVQLPEKTSEMPAWYTEGRVPTEQELVGAPQELMMEAFRRKSAQQN